PLLLPPVPVENEKTFRVVLSRKLQAYKRAYEQYFKRQSRLKRVVRQPLDPLPRVILVPGQGLFSLAIDAQAADVALDIYEHTIGVITNAERIGTYEALPESDLFDMEYWSLEQAKLGQRVEKPFRGKV